jgi:hypothetical protein
MKKNLKTLKNIELFMNSFGAEGDIPIIKKEKSGYFQAGGRGQAIAELIEHLPSSFEVNPGETVL